MTTKLFVLDTNVILHDSACLEHFEEHDIALPITVLEELDQFKKGNTELNFHARQFLRRVDELTGDAMSPQGAALGDGLGRIRVVLGGPPMPEIRETLISDCPDHRILSCALTLQFENRDRRTVLVTKDTNLRMKAKAFGLPSEDYTTDQVKDLDRLYTGKRTIKGVSSDVIDQIYTTPEEFEPGVIPGLGVAIPNENFVLKNGSKSALATYDSFSDRLKRISKPSAFGISARNSEQAFALTALVNDEIKLVTLSGKAGSGKTLLALAAALECRSRYRQILLSRPTVPLSNRDLGFLPGDISAKMDPYMQPLHDNLNVIRQTPGNGEVASKVNELLENGKLEITPLAYIRGRSLPRMFFVIDEAQNLTPHEIKTVITRSGEGTKIVFTGDVRQIDHPYLDQKSNGLTYLINRMVGQPMYSHVALHKSERSPLAELAADLL